MPDHGLSWQTEAGHGTPGSIRHVDGHHRHRQLGLGLRVDLSRDALDRGPVQVGGGSGGVARVGGSLGFGRRLVRDVAVETHERALFEEESTEVDANAKPPWTQKRQT